MYVSIGALLINVQLIWLIECSLSLTDALEEETLVHSREIGSYQQTFSYGVFPFGRRDKFTFKVHIFDIKGFITLEVCPDKLTWINFSKRSAF